MKKRLLSILLTLCIVIALLPRAAHATVSSTDIRYDLSGSGDILYFDPSTGTITGCSAGGESFRDVLNIPSQINGVTVTSIGTNAFENCNHSSIIIPDTVTTIDHHAFCQCHAVSIHIPDSVTTIEDYTFSACRDLTNINISKNVTSIGKYAFSDCAALTSITIPSSINHIGYGAFDGCSSLVNVDIQNGATCVNGFVGCSSLTNIIIPTSVNLIGGDAFYYSGLTDITIPSSVTQIGASAFSATKLTSITIPGSVERIGALVLEDSTIIGTGPFANCSELTSATLSEGVNCIGYRSFAGCAKLTSVTIPKSVTNIEDYAFNGCENLSDIYFGGSESSWNAIERSHYTSGEDATPRILARATIHYNSTGPGMGGTGEDPNPKPNPDPDSPESQEYKVYRNGGYEIFDVSLEECMTKTPSTQYNPQLAHMLIAMCNSVFNSSEMIGTFNSFCFEKKYRYEGTFLTYSMAKKQTEDEDIILVVVRGSESVGDWISNFDFITNDDGLHGGFADSANDLYGNMRDFLGEDMDLSRTRFVITGFSRGAAVCNILAARLADEQIAQSSIYAYTFACPDVGKITADIASCYQCIFNIADVNDMVSWVPSQVLSNDWYKFGKSYWFCHDWNDYKRISRNFGSHNQVAYMDFLRSEKNTYEYTGRDTAIHIVNDAVMRQAIPGSKANGPYLVIACPVDLKIYSSDNRLIGTIIDNTADSVSEDRALVYVFGEEKHIFFLDDDSFTLEFYGTGTGAMTYTVQNMDIDTWESTGSQTFEQVALTDGKQFVSTVRVEESVAIDVRTQDVKLYVLDDSGTLEKEVLPDGEGTEIPITTPGSIYTITLDPHGGTVTPTSSTTNVDGKLASLPTPTRSGYTFNGWFTTPSGGARVTTDTVFSSNTTIYAQWTYVNTSGGNTTPSGSLSSNSSSDTAYNITIPSVAGGTISVSPKSASKGSTVTITATPNVGYELVSVTATDSNGKTITLTDKGNGKYTFTMPGGKVSINAVFQLIQTNEPEVPWDNPFSDISEGEWYYEAVRFVQENGLMNGYGDNTFAPNANLSRAMLAQILYNKEGCPTATGSNAFADVVEGAWYTDAVTWAAANGIVGGYGNGRFGPGDNITREQLAVMLWRYAGEPAATDKELHFTDADTASGYALDALRWVVENGIINGYGDGRLNPGGQATRAQVAQMLMNFLRK